MTLRRSLEISGAASSAIRAPAVWRAFLLVPPVKRQGLPVPGSHPPSLHTCHFESTGRRGLASGGGSTLHHPVRPTSVEAAAHPGEIACFLCDAWSPSSPCRRNSYSSSRGKRSEAGALFLPTAHPPLSCLPPSLLPTVTPSRSLLSLFKLASRSISLFTIDKTRRSRSRNLKDRKSLFVITLVTFPSSALKKDQRLDRRNQTHSQHTSSRCRSPTSF